MNQNQHPPIKVLLIHGLGGEPNGGWRPWLMAELAKHNIYAYALAMPNPDQPILEDWLQELQHQIDLDPQAHYILVGHSLGGATILRYFERQANTRVKAAILVSSPVKVRPEGVGQGFLDKDFDLGQVKANMPALSIVHGDNDSVVPHLEAEIASQQLGAPIITIPNGQHLNGSAGWTELPQVLHQALQHINTNN